MKSVLAWFVLSVVLYLTLAVADDFGFGGQVTRSWKSVVGDAKSLLANVVASFVLYYLVVYLPARRKHMTLRSSCRKMYLTIKREMLFLILSGAWHGGNRDVDLAFDTRERLMDPEEFRKFFDGGREADEGFYAFSNHIQRNEDDFRLIVSKFKSVARQLEFILNNLEIVDQRRFDRLKWVEQSLLDLDDLHANYDDVKTLDKVIWQIFGGWSDGDGYQGCDPILKAIEEL